MYQAKTKLMLEIDCDLWYDEFILGPITSRKGFLLLGGKEERSIRGDKKLLVGSWFVRGCMLETVVSFVFSFLVPVQWWAFYWICMAIPPDQTLWFKDKYINCEDSHKDHIYVAIWNTKEENVNGRRLDGKCEHVQW